MRQFCHSEQKDCEKILEEMRYKIFNLRERRRNISDEINDK